MATASLIPASGSACAHSHVRWVALAGLLAAELILLTTRFDTERLSGSVEWWAGLLGEAHYLPQLVLTIATALLLFAGDRLGHVVANLRDAARAPHPVYRGLVVHLVGFLAFALLTAELFEGSGSGLAFAGWLLAGLVLTVGWCLALLPAEAWIESVRRTGGMLVAGAMLAGMIGFGAGRVAEPLWNRMADGTLVAVQHVLNVGFADVTADPAARDLGAVGFVVRIAPSCSGYEGIGLVIAFTGIFLVLRRDELRFPNALLLLPLGLAMAWTANVFRIATLITIGACGWPEVARGGFHSQAGWLAFNAIALGLIAIGRRSTFFARDIPASGSNPVAAYLAPLIALLGCSLATAAFAADSFDPLYGIRVLAVGVVLWVFRVAYRGGCWSLSWVPVGVGALVFAMWIGMELVVEVSDESAIPDGLARLPSGWAAVWIVARVIGAVLIVPIAEELAFRGYLLRRLQSAEFESVSPRRWSWPAVLLSSLAFGLLHPGRWVAGLIAGVCFAGVYARRGRLADAVIAHAVANALLAAYVLVTRNWSVW